jgi:hypothetical protein
MPRNLGLKLSLDNKTWRKKNRKQIDDKYPNFDVEVGPKICLGAHFLIRRFCTSVSLVRAMKFSSEVLTRTRLSLVRKYECIKSKLHTRLNTSDKHPAFR